MREKDAPCSMAGGTKARCAWACETYVTFIGWKQPIKASDPVKPAGAPRCGFGLDRAIRLDERQTSQSKDRRPAGVSAPPTKGGTARWRVRRKGGDFMAVQDVPVWEKYTLTIEEAARLLGTNRGYLSRRRGKAAATCGAGANSRVGDCERQQSSNQTKEV